jgi:maltose alpha-D-glucosyltransferase/alpha-amylase
MIRVHGDYHLGQLLVAEKGSVLVIDFEGEPGRPLAERRGKTAAAKDVAGMCRSFDYLLRHVAKLTGRPYDTADLERLEACYLAAYREVAAGQPWWPADRETADALLAVFKLDKAIYELAYELNNRPDWIDVPLAAIEEAVATVARSHA